MKLSDVITPGDKIDIKMLHEANQEDNGGEIAKIYQSAVSDIFRIRNWKFLCRQVVEEWCYFNWRGVQHCFYTKGGMYNCTAVVKKRYRKENLYLLRIMITSDYRNFSAGNFSGFLIRHR